MAPRVVFTLGLSPNIQIYFHQHIRKGSATFIPNYSAPHWRSLALDQNTVVLKSHSSTGLMRETALLTPDFVHSSTWPFSRRICSPGFRPAQVSFAHQYICIAQVAFRGLVTGDLVEAPYFCLVPFYCWPLSLSFLPVHKEAGACLGCHGTDTILPHTQ